MQDEDLTKLGFKDKYNVDERGYDRDSFTTSRKPTPTYWDR